MVDFVRLKRLIHEEEKMRWVLERAKSRAEKITTALSKSGGGGGGSGNRSRVEEGAIALASLRDEYQEISEALEAQRNELCAQMRRIDPEKYRLEKRCLGLRYLDGLSVRTIAEALIYSESYVFEKLSKGEKLVIQIQTKDHSSP